MRKVVLKEIDSASPRTSVVFLVSERARNFSRTVWILKVPEVSGEAVHRNDSSGDIASVVAERKPILSQPRYLPCVSRDVRGAGLNQLTYRP